MTLQQINKRLAALSGRLELLLEDAQAIHGELSDLANEQREAFDNMPESLQQSEKGQLSEARADLLEELASELECSLDSIGTFLGTMEAE